MKNQHGQIILILILIMTVALAIGLSVIQRSLSDVSTSSKVEQSSRAFSAAEAGVEKYLSSGSTVVNFDNNSSAAVTFSGSSQNGSIPAIVIGFNRQDLMECPPGNSKMAKEDVAQVWLADPNSSSNPPTEYYKATGLDIYWGDPAATSQGDKAALELTIVYFDGTQYLSLKRYLDQSQRSPDNNFDFPGRPNMTPGVTIDCSGANSPVLSPGAIASTFQCKATIANLLPKLMLLRARMLYNSSSQPFAVQAAAGSVCNAVNTDGCIPSQAKVFTSTGISGQTQRKIQVCQLQKVVPPYFDYAIFSAGDVNK